MAGCLVGRIDRQSACNLLACTPQHIRPMPACCARFEQVADFNLSKVMEGSMASTVGGANNPRWMAPELLDGHQATPATDVFAFGVVMWEVLTWDIPWQTEQVFVVSGKAQGPLIPPQGHGMMPRERASCSDGIACNEGNGGGLAKEEAH
jgi:serine/threonine protein kinase